VFSLSYSLRKLSLRQSRGGSERWDGDRFFCDMNEDRFIEVLQQINLNNLVYETWITADQQGGRDIDWFNMLLRKR